MRHLSFLLLSLSLLLGATSAFSQDAAIADETAVPALKSRVTDLTGTLDASEQQALEQKLATFEQRKGSQLAVLIVASTGQESIEQFGIRVAEQWEIGRKGSDDGLILIVAKADRTLRIEVGYGLEGVIPDAIAKRVISETIVPRFQAGDFAGGIDAGLAQLMSLVDGEALPPPAKRQQRQEGNNPLGMLLMAAMVGGQVLRSMLGPVVAGGVVGAGVFGVAWFVTGTLGMALVLGLGGFFVTLLGIMGLIGNSGFGGGGRGGMSGGGFGGGGGGFGGGGASGRW
ncbi:MAG: TPM domain-containing protein [Pseudomonadota bacterium]